MANLSQEKRQRLRAFLETILETIREEHKDDDEVLIALGEIESELNANIIQPEPLLKLRLNYYKQLFYLVLPCNIQMKLIFTNNFLVE